MPDWVFCANEDEYCDFTGQREVRYGKGSTWTAPRVFTDGVDCSNDIFGDPLYGTIKECYIQAIAPPPPAPAPAPVPAPVPMPAPMPGTIPQQQQQPFQLSQTTLLLIAGGVLLLMFGGGKR